MKDVVVIFDPTIDIDKYGEISIPDYEYGSGETQAQDPETKMSKEMGAYSPFIDINGKKFDYTNIKSCKIEVGDFLPQISLIITDPNKQLQSYASLTDIIVKLYIKSRNRDFKPIRQNYKITSSRSYESEEDGTIINMSGVLFIDKLFSDCVMSFSKKSSFDTFSAIAKHLELGFSANEFSANDVMTRICPNISLLEFIRNDLSLSIYKDDSSFFKVFIDQYYYLNFVEINQMVTLKEEYDKLTEVSTMLTEELQSSGDLVPEIVDFFLTNITSKTFSNNHMANYTPQYNIGSSIDGYGDKLHIQYYDLNDEAYKEFFIEPLVTEGVTDEYETTKSIDPTTKSINFAEQFNDNVHQNFYFAKANNALNNQNINRFNLIVDLDDINPQVRCGMVVPVLIEEKDSERIESQENEGKDENDFVYDRYLSGCYISTAMSYIFESGSFYNKLTLSKREFYKQKIQDAYKDPEKS